MNCIVAQWVWKDRDLQGTQCPQVQLRLEGAGKAQIRSWGYRAIILFTQLGMKVT